MSLLHDTHNINSPHLEDDEKKGEHPNACTEDVILPKEGIKEESPDKNTEDRTWDEDFDAFMIEISSVIEES